MRKVLFLFFCLSGLAFGQIQNQWIILSGYGPTLPGALRYSSGAFQGYNGSSWRNLLDALDTNAIHNELSLKLPIADSSLYTTRWHADSALGTKVNYSDTASALVSSAAKTGFLKYSDWSTFNSKQNALTIGNLSASPPLSQTGGTGAVIGTGVTISADTTVLATHSYVQNLAAGLFEYDANGDLEPATATVYDAFFTTDINGDIEPKP